MVVNHVSKSWDDPPSIGEKTAGEGRCSSPCCFSFEAQQKLGGGFNDFLFSPPSLGFHDAI